MSIPLLLYPSAALTIARTYGVNGSLLRVRHEIRRRTNGFRSTPKYLPRGVRADARALFSVNPRALSQATVRANALERAERVWQGKYQAYRWIWRDLPATTDEWHRHPISRILRRADPPWWRIPHLDSDSGDVKDLWEPARFGWAYDLVRGYLVSGEDRYAEAFHTQFAAWVRSSPPFFGVHWSCGQETAIRAIALLYAEANLATAPSSSPAEMARLEAVLSASGERIADAIGYAVSQRNNHAISEAVGLIVLGARFRGSHPEAHRWLSRGRALIERLIPEQFAADGWYIQHSFTYARLALEQCIIADRTLVTIGERLSDAARTRLGAALELLLAVIEPGTGVIANHGPNDGAFVHPITLAEYRDFRPVLTALCATFDWPLPANVQGDNEVLAWLGLPAPSKGAPLGDNIATGNSGWASARLGGTSVFLRAGRYRSRPGHIDPLQLDVRINGREVIVDPGTYAYNAAAPWNNGLTGAGVHNGPIVDDREPGIRGPRFLWYIWPCAELRHVSHSHNSAVLVAEIAGRVRRTVSLTPDCVEVIDEVLARGARKLLVRWLLHPDADIRSLTVNGAAQLLAATNEQTTGWFSPTYGLRIPSHYVEVERSAAAGLVVKTTIVRVAGTKDPPATSEASADERVDCERRWNNRDSEPRHAIKGKQ